MMAEPIGILGGGVSALAFAFFSGRRTVILEKEDRLGGLCRSFDTRGVACDVGPHIFFSRNAETLDFLTSLTPMERHRRSNRIFYKDRFVKYPFENELSALPDEDRDWCLQTFLNNPHADNDAGTMMAFFLKTFGEGITKTYLEPYNRKIWKFDPALMDTQMVSRIPKPPPEDIVASAGGVSTEGYLHQLHFYYPERGGAESMVRGLRALCGELLTEHVNAPVQKVRRRADGSYEVLAGGRSFEFDTLVSTIPVHELVPMLEPGPPAPVRQALAAMKYNGIHITIAHVAEESLGQNFAVMVPDPSISFHRVSKLDSLGRAYHPPGASTLMAEITFGGEGEVALDDDTVSATVIRDLERIGFVPPHAVQFIQTRTFPYAYVVYDLDHRRNTDTVLAWLNSIGIRSVGRFATFEYINTDQAVERAKDAALGL
jgi:protoporphyrinogen oxidase